MFGLYATNVTLFLQEIWDAYSSEEQDIYLNFNLVLSDVSAFLVDGDYHWNETSDETNLLPVIDKCGIALKLQQVNNTLPRPFFPGFGVGGLLNVIIMTWVAVPSLDRSS